MTGSIVVKFDNKGHLEQLAGAVLAGQYQLTSLLGSGGMGFIYEAEQVGLGRSVAVKLLRPELVETRLDWFRKEAMAASRINHPHAVAIYDFGITDDGLAYLVMEHLRGRTLSSLIEQEPLSPERVVRLGSQCLSALDEAHACGVVHCDLTADNVIVERLRDGLDFAKVIDFGLAQLYRQPGANAPLVGTAEYVSPEQIRGHAVSPQTDLYAIGVLLYEMIVGRTPFAGASKNVVLEGHLDAEPDAPHNIIPTCPPELGELILDALSKSPDARPASAALMRTRLLEVFPSSASPTTTSAARKHRPTPPRSYVQQPANLPHNTRLTGTFGHKDTVLVGRAEELEQIVSFCAGQRDTSTMLIVGPHGIGKARLTQSATQRAGANTKVLAGASDPSGLKLSWYPILGVLEQALELVGTPTLKTIAAAAAHCGLPERDVPGLAEAFGLEGPAMELELNVRRREAKAATLRALQSLGRRHTNVVIIFADADRYDHPSLQIIGELQGNLPVNLRLIITTESVEALGDDVGSGLVDRLQLHGLPPQHARSLLRTLAGPSRSVPDALAIQSITSGSPAALEQLAGWIRLGHGTSSVPSLLVDLVSIRVNRLPAEARRVLQAVAIHGTVAPRALVESTIEDPEKKALLECTWTGLLVVGLESLTIPTDLVSQVISACTPADVRRNLHRRALRAYGDAGPAGIRGHHAEQSDQIEIAYELYLKAGNDAVRRFDDPGASVWYGRAVACARAMHAQATEGALSRLAGASVQLAEVLRQIGELGLATGVCEEAQLFGPDDQQRAMIHRTLGIIAATAGKAQRSIDCLRLAIGDALRAGDREFLCQCYLDLTDVLDSQKSSSDATEELQEGIDVITLGDGLCVAKAPNRLWRLGMKLAERQLADGKLKEAHVTAQETLALANRSTSCHARGRASALLAQICEAAGERSAALRHRSNAIDAMRKVGDRRSTAELLIETARSTIHDERPLTAKPDAASTMSLARKLALEVGWVEGADLSAL